MDPVGHQEGAGDSRQRGGGCEPGERLVVSPVVYTGEEASAARVGGLGHPGPEGRHVGGGYRID